MIRTLLLSVVATVPCIAIAQTAMLEENRDGDRVLANDVALRVDGKLITPALGGAEKSLKLEVRAKHLYRSRALPAAGRDEAALRSLRHYDAAEASIIVEGNKSSSNLAADRRTFVADGHRDGIRYHAPDFALSTSEIELLDVPGDPLAIVAMMPGDSRDVGDSWAAPHWAVQMLAGLEALEKSDVNCRFESVTEGSARIDFAGAIVGGRRGSRVELEISGHCLFDVENRFVTHVELTQRDKRSIGPVNPGVEVTASVVVDRKLTTNERDVTAGYARTLPLEPSQRSLLVAHPLPWNAELLLDRSWYLFHQTSQVALLRRMRSGNLVAQCNVTRVDAAAPGKHLAEKRFTDDITTALGEQLRRIADSGEIETGDDRFAYRVTAVGENEIGDGTESRTVPMHWIYYLVAAPSGRQLSFVFVVESELLPQLDGADEAIVRASRFLEPRTPTRAARREP